MTQIYKTAVSDIIEETHDVKTLRLNLTEGKEFSFLPGQFLMLTIDSDSEKQRRAYSISSSPLLQGFIEITFRIEGSFTSKLGKLRVGEGITITGPYGHFTFNETIKHDIALIAGGTGIAPFRSYIQYIIDKKLSNKIVLLYSSKTPKDIIYYNELRTIEQANKNLKCVFTVTRHEDSANEILTGRIDEDMIKNYIGNLSDKLFYSCGPTALVNDVVSILKNNNVNEEQIKTEKWG